MTQHTDTSPGPPAASDPSLDGQPPLPERVRWMEDAFEWTLIMSRALVLAPVVLLVLSAAGAFVYGGVVFVRSIVEVVHHPFPVGHNIGAFLVIVDLFLIGATLLIAAIGFYELFISRVDVGGRRDHLPRWLVMHDLNDLKARVISMLVLVMGTTFVDVVVSFEGGRDVLYLGAGVALTVAALTVFVRAGTGWTTVARERGRPEAGDAVSHEDGPAASTRLGNGA